MNESCILMITCKDKKGLLAKITGFIFENNGNIISLNEFVDNENKTFFMRVEWELQGFKIKKEKINEAIQKLSVNAGFSDSFEIFFSNKKVRMAIFVSKYDHCLYDLLLRQKSGELNCDIPIIISNHRDLKHVADSFNIPFEYVNMEKNKEIAEKKQIRILKKYDIEFITLARYMQVLSKEFIKKYENKIINIHHSFLPAFEGAKPYHQAYERGVKLLGATAHFANHDLDKGPIITQGVISTSHKDSVEDMVIKGRDIEKKVLSDAVKLYIEKKIFVLNNKTIIL